MKVVEVIAELLKREDVGFFLLPDGHSSSANSVALSTDGRTIISGSWDNTIKVWDLETDALAATFNAATTVRAVTLMNP